MPSEGAESRLRDAIEQRNSFADLLRSPGWDALSKVISAQIEQRRNRFELVPLESLDEVYAQEFLKGELATLRLILSLPQDALDDAQAVIDETKETRGPDEDG